MELIYFLLLTVIYLITIFILTSLEQVLCVCFLCTVESVGSLLDKTTLGWICLKQNNNISY